MLELAGDVDLPEETFAGEGGGQLGSEHLDGDRAIVLEVEGPKDGSRRPAAQLGFNPVHGPEIEAEAF